MEDTKHAVQVRPAASYHLTCHLKPLRACAYGLACTCRCRHIAITAASVMQLRRHLPLSACCQHHSFHDAVAVAPAKARCLSASKLYFECMVCCYPACTHWITLRPQHKWNQAEDYLEADLRPRSASDAAAQAGYIPSNTQDVLASRGGR